ncbi:MAG: flagellar hook protein FlgE [Desulfobulbaceae bacterium]|nr:flagellar hook protein FlgE [Candidatus Kapabacteria bacterium]MBS4000071.1 flagellar hook protein FlgE [Desulfobulbaceae bacterium]
MGLTRSLSNGATSLRAHQQRFDVISNNLANLNTIGYKSNRANFQEQFNQVINHGRNPDVAGAVGNGGINPLQFGLGVKMGSITQDMNQGNLQITNRPLDLAIQGSGFFAYQMNGEMLYSRAGNVSRDRDGFLIDTGTGAYLQGYNVENDANGNPIRDVNGVNQLTGTRANLLIPENIQSAPKQTQTITMTGNLNSGNAEGIEKKTSISIIDNVGGTHELKFTFTKTANPNEYDLIAELNGNSIPISAAQVLFNNDGTLNSPLSIDILASDLNVAIGNQVFDETTPKDISVVLADPNQLSNGITGYAAANSVTFIEQDGHKSGSLVDLSVDTRGQIWGAFTNGKSEKLGQVLLAKFTNDEGLIRKGGNFYSESPNSGNANIGTAGDIFPSSQIAGNSLEMSNVDMTEQFTDMISTQRAYEASARVITVSDQLLQETTILKR